MEYKPTKEEWEKLTGNVQAIKTALAGDEGLGTKGLLDDHGKTKDRVQKLEDTDNQRKGILWVLGILWIGLVALVNWIIHK